MDSTFVNAMGQFYEHADVVAGHVIPGTGGGDLDVHFLLYKLLADDRQQAGIMPFFKGVHDAAHNIVRGATGSVASAMAAVPNFARLALDAAPATTETDPQSIYLFGAIMTSLDDAVPANRDLLRRYVTHYIRTAFDPDQWRGNLVDRNDAGMRMVFHIYKQTNPALADLPGVDVYLADARRMADAAAVAMGLYDLAHKKLAPRVSPGVRGYM